MKEEAPSPTIFTLVIVLRAKAQGLVVNVALQPDPPTGFTGEWGPSRGRAAKGPSFPFRTRVVREGEGLHLLEILATAIGSSLCQ